MITRNKVGEEPIHPGNPLVDLGLIGVQALLGQYGDRGELVGAGGAML